MTNKKNNSSTEKNTRRISRVTALWILIMAGLIYHTVLHLVPIFYGINIEKPGATGTMPQCMVFTLGLSFLIPVTAIVAINYLKKSGQIINLILALFALLINTGHLSEFFFARHFDPTQLFVIIPLFLITILLAIDSWRLIRNKTNSNAE